MEATPIHITTDSFEKDVIGSDIPVVVDFWAPWCGPCRMIGPVLESLAQTWQGEIKVAKVNVDEEPKLAGRFGVQGIPTLLAFGKGELVHTEVGFRGREPLEDLFDRLANLDDQDTAEQVA